MIIGIIPARYGSTRFEGKPLIDIQGKSMIQAVYEKASQAKCLDKLIVATDDIRIFDHVQSFGAEVVMTHQNHPSGTDRCWEAYCKMYDIRCMMSDLEGQKLEFKNDVLENDYMEKLLSNDITRTIHHTSYIIHKKDYIINIQGDEPFIDPAQIDELGLVLDGAVELATQMIAVDSAEVLWDMGEVKIVLNDQQEALYFSRQVIPFLKNIKQADWHLNHSYFRHVGMYAYRADVLQKLTKLPMSSLEKAESLEQLRWLEAGFKIKCVTTKYDSHCIDTPEDIEKVLKIYANK
jgi:3-deoxy-manno-octulosonate cytidylyltransferase (CMP-KDO synthetase)